MNECSELETLTAARAVGLLLGLLLPMTAEEAPPLTLQQAVLMALERNQQLRAERLTPAIVGTGVDRARAAFDPTAELEVSQTRSDVPGTGATATTAAQTGLSATLPTGTTLGLGLSGQQQHQDWSDAVYDQTRAGLSLTQALLKGGGLEANLASIRQARLDLAVSHQELRAFTTTLVAAVESGYWDLSLAEQQWAIVNQAVQVAEQQWAEAKALAAAGKLAEVELVAAEAELATRQTSAIDARSACITTRMKLLCLLNPPGPSPLTRSLVLAEQPFMPVTSTGPVEEHLDVARNLRADLQPARLQAQRGQLELVRTRNGLLPQLDFFIQLGRTGYADSFSGALAGDDGHGWDGAIGLRLSLPVGNREARAAHRRASLGQQQLQEAMANLEQLAEADIRLAWCECDRTRQQIAATATARRLQTEKARIEGEKLTVGKSTTLVVAQAERDRLGASQAEARAVVNHLKAIIDLQRLDGSLLERRGIAVAGEQ